MNITIFLLMVIIYVAIGSLVFLIKNIRDSPGSCVYYLCALMLAGFCFACLTLELKGM